MPERTRNLRPVREVTSPSLQYRTIHGYKRAFRIAGSGPAILLIHGIGDNSTTWAPIHAKLAQRFTVIAPDLLGHGKSDKPRADYSAAAYANGMRDLLSVLDIERVTIVGHSLGGGVAMQFAYQFPHLVDRLILVGAGGVTKDVNIALRFASLPMGAEALALLRLPMVLPAVQLLGQAGRPRAGFDGHRPRSAQHVADPERPARADRLVGVHPHAASGGGLARTDRHNAGPMLSDRSHPGADRLGRKGFRDPRPARLHGPRRDARLSDRDILRRRPFPLPRRPGPVPRRRAAIHRQHRAPEYDQAALRNCFAPVAASARSPGLPTPESRCSTPWEPTSAAQPRSEAS